MKIINVIHSEDGAMSLRADFECALCGNVEKDVIYIYEIPAEALGSLVCNNCGKSESSELP